MKVNWKIRFKNGAWLASMAAIVISFVYTVLDMLGIIPEFPQERVVQIVHSLLTFLGLIGVVTDPTTVGLNDSKRAMGYEQPWDDNVDYDGPTSSNG